MVASCPRSQWQGWNANPGFLHVMPHLNHGESLCCIIKLTKQDTELCLNYDFNYHCSFNTKVCFSVYALVCTLVNAGEQCTAFFVFLQDLLSVYWANGTDSPNNFNNYYKTSVTGKSFCRVHCSDKSLAGFF